MEFLEIGEIATLEENKEFICLAAKNLNGNNYVYLISNYKPLEVRFCRQYIDNGVLKMDIITDPNLKKELLELFIPKEEAWNSKKI